MPDYVNELPEGCDPDTPRCKYVFYRSPEYKREDVLGRPCGLPVADREDIFGRPCGLPVADDERGRDEELCYFHSERPRRGDEKLRGELEAAVARGAYLVDARLSEAELEKAQLQGANLWGAELQGAILWRAELQGANLSEAKLQRANLLGAELQRANLSGAELQRALLWVAELQGANLSFAELQDANLVEAELQGANLRRAELQETILERAKLQGVDLWGAKLNDADLRKAIIAPIHEIDTNTNLATVKSADLCYADLSGALLSEITISPEVDLSSVILDYPICDEVCARNEAKWAEVRGLHYLTDEDRPTFAQCEAVYRQLKLSFQESGDYQRAGDFFLREMECKRAQQSWWPRLGYGLMHWLCGYGERASRLAARIALVIVCFAFLHGWAGIIDPDSGKYRLGPGLGWPFSEQSWPALWEGFQAWLTSLYFSVITFTSLGYADLAPGPGWGKAFAGLEAALGIVLMSLLLVVIVRKWSR